MIIVDFHVKYDDIKDTENCQLSKVLMMAVMMIMMMRIIFMLMMMMIMMLGIGRMNFVFFSGP